MADLLLRERVVLPPLRGSPLANCSSPPSPALSSHPDQRPVEDFRSRKQIVSAGYHAVPRSYSKTSAALPRSRSRAAAANSACCKVDCWARADPKTKAAVAQMTGVALAFQGPLVAIAPPVRSA